MGKLSHTDADRGLWRPDFSLPGCPGASQWGETARYLGPCPLQLFLLLSVGEDCGRKGWERRTAKGIRIVVTTEGEFTCQDLG